MIPELFHIGGFSVHSFGLMMALGFLAAIQLARWLARRSNLKPDIFSNIAIIGLLAGVAGARLSHVLENFGSQYHSFRSWADVWDAINITSGGLTFYGGLILAFPACVAYGIYKKVPLRLGMDIVAPCIMLGLAIGRVGCFMNGCCFGRECSADYPLAVSFPHGSYAWQEQVQQRKLPQFMEMSALPVHPAQLYSTFNSLLVTATLVAFFTMAGGTGRVFSVMLVMEGASRFLLESVRAEPHDYWGHTMSFSMVLGLLLAGVGLLMSAAIWRMNRQTAMPATIIAS